MSMFRDPEENDSEDWGVIYGVKMHSKIQVPLFFNNQQFITKWERRPITLEGEEKDAHLKTEVNYGEGTEEEDRDEGEGREPREEA